MNNVPKILSFELDQLDADQILLSWTTENAHSIQLQSIGDFHFEQQYKARRDPKKTYNFVLIALNLDSNIQTTERLLVYPAPQILSFSQQFLGQQLQLSWQLSGAKKISLNGEEIPLQREQILLDLPAQTQSYELKVWGENPGELVQQTLEVVPPKKDYGPLLRKIAPWAAGALGLGLLLFLGLQFWPKTKAKTAKKELQQIASSYAQDCGPKSLEQLQDNLPKMHQLLPEERYKTFACLRQAYPQTDFTLAISETEGLLFESLEEYCLRPKFVLQVEELRWNKDSSRLRISANSQERLLAEDWPEAQEKEAPAKTEETPSPKAATSAPLSSLPIQFQGKINGRLRRIRIQSQEKHAQGISFQYKVFGRAKSHLKGELRFEGQTVELEGLGQGTYRLEGGKLLFDLPKASLKAL
ncbi:hypothetical protein [Saprospira grandis]|uniref:Uncharacterized protein n=1 Tax=Saprospira grandis (strain Lewin) TaxID=984262 RepID=H6L028_SAPGL|nr:hypothetical protein [Saprospira grandis]AFC26035.1 hypothetical protein SGRA_3308 [Saprospira grandis str. Lewin]